MNYDVGKNHDYLLAVVVTGVLGFHFNQIIRIFII